MRSAVFRLTAALFGLSLAAALPAGAQLGDAVPLPRAASPESVGFSAERLQRLDAAMRKMVDDGRVAGMTTVLARHGKVVSYEAYGKKSLAAGAPMTRDAIFRIYSMTKPITFVGMMILFEEGKWCLDDPTNDLIFVGMIQVMGGPVRLDLQGLSRTLTYQALVDPEE